MKFNRNVKEIGYKDKVILANCLNGYWIRLTKGKRTIASTP